MHESGRPAELAAPEAPAAPPRRRFSGAEWDRLVREGFFRPEERLELIDGEVRVMSPIGDPHATIVAVLAEALTRAYGRGFVVRQEAPFSIADLRLYPDVEVLRGGVWDYYDRAPTPRDACLVAEVADSTAPFDLGEKAALYAAGGVPEYWVVDISRAELVVHRGRRRRRRAPRGWAWGEVVRLQRGRLRPPLARRTVSVRELLPPPP